ncbi:superoxide dismutase family protein [Pectobacterium aroidearum]|uniref:Superoxide dismutase [Cu-Zn] n=1 Tax=Pectobacterium aroidearum TaxID=1201031 RepID=A0ABR5Z979_9GAMM|nr:MULTISPECIES: superoxide dismutase family protein [Pectobacterium]MBA5198299.1 superoxide dismutase family protein [Pectobacterium aroidearum]MBA5227197.1 superoxide dismutase family protein [Pectobacterium aroidearum]MBA5231092.1 superoxide dismutase family protein [Pectobacterium aroidearum]MBA5235447.1 superoxide dismutase family protein [Pectobacterium aroidearum]MBA5736238.1 superoxide dismutase family protein [Pectobacterium aroidearum]
MKLKALILTGVFFSCSTFAASTTVTLNEALPTGAGNSIGEVSITETPYGLLFTPSLKGLEAGIHGFHVHENASCEPAEQDGKPVPALAAGGHLDPKKTGKHLGPYDDQGHLGDLPGLVVNADGTATYPILAPRIKSLSEVKNHALMVHVGGDNYADTPAKLGGGGARMACGVIK